MSKYAVIRVGRSVGSSPFTTIGIYNTKREAQTEADFRDSQLSTGEKEYFNMKYRVIALTPRNVDFYDIEL